MTGPIKFLIWAQVLAAATLGKHNLSRYNIRTKQGWETRIKLADPIHDALTRIGATQVPATTVRAAITFDNFLMSNFSTDFLEYIYSHGYNGETNPIQTLRLYLGFAPDYTQIWKASKNVYRFLQMHKLQFLVSQSESSSEEHDDNVTSIQDEITVISKLEKSLRKRKNLLKKKPSEENGSLKNSEELSTNIKGIFSRTSSFAAKSSDKSSESDTTDEDKSNSGENWDIYHIISKLVDWPIVYSVPQQSYSSCVDCKQHKCTDEPACSYQYNYENVLRTQQPPEQLSINDFLIRDLMKIIQQITQLRKVALTNIDTRPSLMKYINTLHYASVTNNHDVPEADIKKVTSNLVRYLETLINAMPDQDRKLDKPSKNRLRKAIENSLLSLFRNVPMQKNQQKIQPGNPELKDKHVVHLYKPHRTKTFLMENHDHDKLDENVDVQSNERYADFRRNIDKAKSDNKSVEHDQENKINDEITKRALPVTNETQNPIEKRGEEPKKTILYNLEQPAGIGFMTHKPIPSQINFGQPLNFTDVIFGKVMEKKMETGIPVNRIGMPPFHTDETKSKNEKMAKITEILQKQETENFTDATETTARKLSESMEVVTAQQLKYTVTEKPTEATAKLTSPETHILPSQTTPREETKLDDRAFTMDSRETLHRYLPPKHKHRKHGQPHQRPMKALLY